MGVALAMLSSPGAAGQTEYDPEVPIRSTPSLTASAVRPVSAGGVRIRSFRGRALVMRRPPVRETHPGVSRFDLDELERRILVALDRRFNELYDELLFGRELFSAAGPGSYVVLYPAEGDAAPDTVRIPVVDPAAERPRTEPTAPGLPRRLAEARRAALSPLLQRIETEIFDTGLFNAVSVNFEFGGSNILPGSEHALDAIGDILTRHPDLYLRVEGHTDNIGGRAVNQRLSEVRARAAKEYILNRFPSIEPGRLEPVGMGMEQPIASNATETGRAMNRRVVFRITDPPVREPIIPDVPLVQRMEYRPTQLIDSQYLFDW